MKVTNPIPGGVAKSLIGRDAGRLYLIVKAEGENVYLCDGKYRKAKPTIITAMYYLKKNCVPRRARRNLL